MLRAKLRGKQTDEIHEDGLTAIVFSRLSYLPAKMAWSILADAARRYPSQPPDADELVDMLTRAAAATPFKPKLWPRLQAASGDGHVEPDALLAGPGFLAVIEAKQPGLGDDQTQSQISREVSAARASKYVGTSTKVFAVLIEPPPDLGDWRKSLDVPVLGIRWCDIADSVQQLVTEDTAAPHEVTILTDALGGLAATRVHAVSPMAGLPEVPRFAPIPESFPMTEAT